MRFYYQRGPVWTKTHWRRPTKELATSFLFWAIPKAKELNLEIWLQGAFLRDPLTTWDLDMVLLGDCEDEQALESLQLALLDKALNHYNLLLDPYWASDLCKMTRLPNGVWTSSDTIVKMIHPIIKLTEQESFKRDRRSDPTVVPLTEYMLAMNYKDRILNAKHQELLDQKGGFEYQSALDWLKAST
jgi:hypothetical protein